MTYSIGEFAKIAGITTSTLRYYESEGLLTPRRKENNLRAYTDSDIDWVQFLLHLKDSGMSIKELRQYTQWRAMGDEMIPKRLQLIERRKHLVEEEIQVLHQSLDILNHKISFFTEQLKDKKV